MQGNKLAIVVPCYKEEAVLEETTRQLTQVIDRLVAEQLADPDSLILYVNDGSSDRTWPLIVALHQQNPYVCGVNLANNVGHQNALMAGLEVASRWADAIVTIDVDLQDDVQVIRDMMVAYGEGKEIVYGVRKKRETDTWFKRTTALAFYSLMKKMGVKSVYNHADYRLMSRRSVEALLEYRERNLFIRGLVPLLGYETACVYYDRKERFAGESKYPFRKMLAFAMDGITSFSVKPVHFVLLLGVCFLFIALGILAYVVHAWVTGNSVPGWSSLMLSLWFCSGCTLIALGIVGEYIGKIYIEVKNRPRYHIERILAKEGAV